MWSLTTDPTPRPVPPGFLRPRRYDKPRRPAASPCRTRLPEHHPPDRENPGMSDALGVICGLPRERCCERVNARPRAHPLKEMRLTVRLGINMWAQQSCDLWVGAAGSTFCPGCCERPIAVSPHEVVDVHLYGHDHHPRRLLRPRAPAHPDDQESLLRGSSPSDSAEPVSPLLIASGQPSPSQASNPPFAGLATEGLHLGLGGLELDRPVEEAVANIMDGFAELHMHPDVPDGLSALAELGIRLVTLSNGSASIAQRPLSGAGPGCHFERFLSVEGALIWKPASAAYDYGLAECGVKPADTMPVAAHTWDTDGAQRAGLTSARSTGPGQRSQLLP